jgi:hypothetical protein
MSSRRTLEARTIRDAAQLREFLDAIISATGVGERNADTIHLATPVDMRLVEITLSDGSRVYDLVTARW